VKRTRRLFAFLSCCCAVAVLLAGPQAALASCYRVATYYKQAAPAYVAPPHFQPAASIYLVPAVPLFSVGPGYAAPAPPPAPAHAPGQSPCDKQLAAFEAKLDARLKQLEGENALLRGILLRGQSPAPPQSTPSTLPAPAAAPAKAPAGDLSWLTGANGCAACHGGAEPVKGIDYSQGLDGMTAKQLMLTIRNLDSGKMPPEDPKAYEKRGIAGPHPKPTKDQLDALSARLEAMKQ